MPHILTKKHSSISIPSSLDGVDFNFIATSPKEDKISVSVENKTFFLTKLNKNGNDLIKVDSTTRVTPVSIVKKAIKAYGKLCNSEILFSNIESQNTKLEPKKEYLKDINYFVNEFSCDKEICVEVGFGSGRHLLYQAKTNPHIQYIGLEIHTPSIEQMLKQVKLEGLTNILAVNYDARLFLEFLQSNSVSRIFVHFPVPWDKKPHRRVMSKEFIDESLRVLKIDGSLELRTDSPKYYEYSKELLESYTQEKTTIEKNQDLQVSSKYEDRWKRQGKDIWDLTIYANKNFDDITIDKDFSFHLKDFSFEKVKDSLPPKPLVKDGFVVHFEHTYTIDGSNGLIHLTMGGFNKPLAIYLIIENNQVDYFQNDPIPTSANKKAHLLIENILNGEES
jgi:tRNA (guanine-N7-)-methyltransferase